MLFFNNPKRRSGGRRRKSRTAARKRARRVVRVRARSTSKGVRMARKRARRTHRRRRRSIVAFGANPRRRRRHRRYGRNPSIGSIVQTLKGGLKDGAVILASQVATKRSIAFVSSKLPVTMSPVVRAAIPGLVVPVAITLVARKVAPAYARLAAAASFAEGIRNIVAATSPTAAALLGDADVVTEIQIDPDTGDVIGAGDDNGYGAYNAYPGMGAYNDYDYATMIQ